MTLRLELSLSIILFLLLIKLLAFFSCHPNPSIHGSISFFIHALLDSVPTPSKIRNVVFSFKPFKSPGPDGFYPFMYQKYWDILGPPLLDFYTLIFSSHSVDPRVNSTYLCLIPKCKNATNFKNFRPVGLYNTKYKIITKIIINRIKPYLQAFIGLNQDSFLSKRRASNNAIIFQEYLRHLKKLKGRTHYMILKIDLEKAFDRLKWSFIRHALFYFNFPPGISKLIMSYLSSSSISILINGGKIPAF